MLKLHDLTVGQRFTFTDKHRGKVFEVNCATSHRITFEDIATGEYRSTASNRKTFRMEVELVTENRVVELTPREEAVLVTALMLAIKISAEDGEPESSRNELNKLYLKLTGIPGRRTVLTEN